MYMGIVCKKRGAWGLIVQLVCSIMVETLLNFESKFKITEAELRYPRKITEVEIDF